MYAKIDFNLNQAVQAAGINSSPSHYIIWKHIWDYMVWLCGLRSEKLETKVAPFNWCLWWLSHIILGLRSSIIAHPTVFLSVIHMVAMEWKSRNERSTLVPLLIFLLNQGLVVWFFFFLRYNLSCCCSDDGTPPDLS